MRTLCVRAYNYALAGQYEVMENARKTYVGTVVRFGADGLMMPLAVLWTDGRRFDISRCGRGEIVPAAGGTLFPLRYDCEILGRLKRLYFETETRRWFVVARGVDENP